MALTVVLCKIQNLVKDIFFPGETYASPPREEFQLPPPWDQYRKRFVSGIRRQALVHWLNKISPGPADPFSGRVHIVHRKRDMGEMAIFSNPPRRCS